MQILSSPWLSGAALLPPAGLLEALMEAVPSAYILSTVFVNSEEFERPSPDALV